MNITLQKSDKLSTGERLIVVDGVTWGRTIVSFHGCHGTRHAFRQEHGELIGDVNKGGYFHEVSVRSEKKRSYLGDADQARPTLERVLEKAKELIDAGRLRHPDVVKAEQEQTRERMRQSADRREREEQAKFEVKAREALGINSDEQSDVVDRVVAAMRWAQAQ